MELVDLNKIEIEFEGNYVENFNIHINDKNDDYWNCTIKSGKIDGQVIRKSGSIQEIFYVKDGKYNGLYRKYNNNELIQKILYLAGNEIERIVDNEVDEDLPF